MSETKAKPVTAKPAPRHDVKKRVLFALGERELNATSSRLLRWPRRMAALGYAVDVMTHDVKLMELIEREYAGMAGIRTLLLKPEDRFWTMRQRDGFAKTFIRLYGDIVIPGSDLPHWKIVAFDDFLWHVSRSVMPAIEEEYGAVFLPAPSSFERPSESCDVFYTNLVYYCKQRGVPLAGIQVYPITDVPPVYLNLPDYWLVNDPRKARFLRDHGVDAARVMVVDDSRDAYCIDTVEDALRGLTLDEELEIPRDTLAVSIINHTANRMQITEIIEALGRFKRKKCLFFVFVGTTVRELTEQAVFDDLIAPRIKQHIGDYYTVETAALLRTLMLCDVIVSTSYVLPLSLAREYGKTGVVYNPLRPPSGDYIDDVEIAATREELTALFAEAWRRKQAETRLADVMKKILP